jgi:hypothetical protein
MTTPAPESIQTEQIHNNNNNNQRHVNEMQAFEKRHKETIQRYLIHRRRRRRLQTNNNNNNIIIIIIIITQNYQSPTCLIHRRRRRRRRWLLHRRHRWSRRLIGARTACIGLYMCVCVRGVASSDAVVWFDCCTNAVCFACVVDRAIRVSFWRAVRCCDTYLCCVRVLAQRMVLLLLPNDDVFNTQRQHERMRQDRPSAAEVAAAILARLSQKTFTMRQNKIDVVVRSFIRSFDDLFACLPGGSGCPEPIDVDIDIDIDIDSASTIESNETKSSC